MHYVRYQGDRNKMDWANHEDKNIMISNGEILCGVLCKAQCGNVGGGIVHIIWKEFGAEICKNFLS